MNYFLKINENFIRTFPFEVKYKIDDVPFLKKDITFYLNNINETHKHTIKYTDSDNTIHQTLKDQLYNLGVDYIGPSRYYLTKQKIKEDIIALISISSRFIGGHILFPTNQFEVNKQLKSLNQLRSYRFKERLDYFLLELKKWYANQNEIKEIERVFNGNKEWFLQYGNFNGYIDYYLLNDFVDENYNVYDLTSYDSLICCFQKTLTKQPTIEHTGDFLHDLEAAYIPQDYSLYAL